MTPPSSLVNGSPHRPDYRSVFREGLFDGRVVLVTGGGSGIGRCTAHELGALGATVALLGRDRTKLESVQAEGEGELAQLLDLILVGNVTSLHMAFQEGVDPGPIPAQDHIKDALATAAGEDEGALR